MISSMRMRTKTDCPAVVYHDLADDVTAFSTTRHGGHSCGMYSSFNVCDYCGDNPQNVRSNRLLLCDELAISPDRLVLPRQTHDTVVRLIDDSFLSLADDARSEALYGVDSVITAVPEVCIGISTADCVPVLFYDSEHRAVGAAHAGWRGTVAGMAAKTVRAMIEVFGTDPAQLKTVIGPCISLDAFEVGDEVYDVFCESGFDMSLIARRMGKWHINLSECNALQLQYEGVNPANIHKSGICTHANVDDFFSARRLGTASGRIYTGIIVRQKHD